MQIKWATHPESHSRTRTEQVGGADEADKLGEGGAHVVGGGLNVYFCFTNVNTMFLSEK